MPEKREPHPDEIHLPTDEEAIALALALCPPGESFSIHEAYCAVTPEHPEACDCTPMTLKPGAHA